LPLNALDPLARRPRVGTIEDVGDETQARDRGGGELGAPDLELIGDWTELSGARVVYDGKFLEGRDGFLFMADDNNNVIAQHRGMLRLDEAQLEGWRAVLEGRTKLLAEHGAQHLVLVAPNNHSVYPEKLPEEIEAAPERPVHQLIAHLEQSGSPVNIIYPLDELVAAKPERLVCSQVDSHWTDYGAFLAFTRLMNEAQAVVPTREVARDDVLFIDITVNGDLGGKLEPKREATQAFGRLRYRSARLIYDNCVEGTGALAVTECDPAPPTTCLLLGDSYSYFIVRYLSECWRRLVFAHSPTLDRAVVETVRPDLAVTVIAERFLVVVPDDQDPGRTLRSREERKRSIGRTRHPLLHWAWPTLISPGPVERMRSRLLGEGRIRDAALVGVMAYAGLRPAEAMALRWSHIAGDSILVEPLPRRREAGCEPRRVPLWQPLAADLKAWRAESGGGDNQFIFSAPGKPWAVDLRDWRDRTYPDLARDAGIRSSVPSFLRHVFCVLLINAGVTVEELAELTDMDIDDLTETFRGLLEDAERVRSLPVEQAIAEARESTPP
jgi:alginate O-acetyltransferase complex protein AlgJ